MDVMLVESKQWKAKHNTNLHAVEPCPGLLEDVLQLVNVQQATAVLVRLVEHPGQLGVQLLLGHALQDSVPRPAAVGCGSLQSQ